MSLDINAQLAEAIVQPCFLDGILGKNPRRQPNWAGVYRGVATVDRQTQLLALLDAIAHVQ